ncbi:hypothetical protein [Chamaesiphon sp. VAR_48_metabat_403]|uniref:hypothetical protein n=1 Tax=Chamaesiphon sp. VAR_48_metabat_403 TaxID=2964700 RepID=UPI00286D6CF0|nr:hypothetical protein [Chamaesiphon sp. VAR_48_metabat_403]
MDGYIEQVYLKDNANNDRIATERDRVSKLIVDRQQFRVGYNAMKIYPPTLI